MNYTPLLEPLFQELRIVKVLPYIPRGSRVVDIGCDEPQVLLSRIAPHMRSCIGIDIVVREKKEGNITILQQDLQKKVMLPSRSADVITMLAVLEHMKHPKEIVEECFRILKPGGMLLVTVPSPASKPVLEFFSAIGLVRKEMIHQHENYFTKEKLQRLAKQTGFSQVHVESFEFGYNTCMRAVK